MHVPSSKNQTEAQRPTADGEGGTQVADPSNRHLDLAYSMLGVRNQTETRRSTIGGCTGPHRENFLKMRQRLNCVWG
jgi:hypothetical protein